MRTAPVADYDPDLPLVQAIGSGDRYAFEEFLRRQEGWVKSLIYGVLGDRHTIEDVAQQVWAAVWQRAAELREPRAWRSWLYRLTRNAALDGGREASRRRKRGQSDAGLAAVPAPSEAPGGNLVNDERHKAVLAAIEGLPALYREPFVLRHVNGWSYKEIAEVMAMPVDSIETRLVRARRLLREALRDQLG